MAIKGIYDERDDIQYVFKKYELTSELDNTSLELTFSMLKQTENVGERVVSAPVKPYYICHYTSSTLVN